MTPSEMQDLYHLRDKVREVRNLCSYKRGWSIYVKVDYTRKAVYVQVGNSEGVCSVTGEPYPWKGRKHYISKWMCKQELVGIIFGAIKHAELHEMHEWFRYKGRSIYNPHLCPDALAELASKAENFNARQDSMVRA